MAAATAAQPQVVLTVDPKHRIIEGVASNGRTIWVSSVLDRQILACNSGCRVMATLPEPLHPLGIAWDWSRDLLWIAADCPQLPSVPKCAKGSLVALNAGGRIVARFAPPLEFHPGDVSVSLHAVFVSDSQNGLVYGLLPRRSELRAINAPGDGKSAQGTALTPDGASVIVADYSRGIGRIDMKSTSTAWLPQQDGKPLTGVDGLARCGDRYFGIYNGGSPGRILSIVASKRRVEVHDFPLGVAVKDPTQIAFDGKRLLVIAKSGWETVGSRIQTRGQGARVISIPLANGCGT